ncbi:hypothetical protein WBG78_20535 [Chryseolinea sp. T2]|uniref:hypothetical protein n=1 Tax=Chryseolinea sp. T2 TaxID=3129255 RepID=UPI003078871B
MSHNPALVLITNVHEQNYELLLKEVQLDVYVSPHTEPARKDVNLMNITYDYFTDRLWIGHYNQVLIMVNGLLAREFVRIDSSATEYAFVKAFPQSDIVSLSYASTSTSYSYAVIRNGKKMRVKNGSQDGTLTDFGDLLPIERELSVDDVISPGDLEDLQADRSSEEVEMTVEGLRGSSVMHRLVADYLGGLELYSEGLQAIPVTEFVRR